MIRRFGVVVVLATAAAAQAQPAQVQAQADALFNSGRDLMTAKKFAQACAAFEASQKLAAAPTTMLNLADCREQNGQVATAQGWFLEVERELRSATSAADLQLRDIAKAHAAKLGQIVSKLTITVAAPTDDLEILRDKEKVDRAVWGQTLPIDGGTYVITARAPGRTAFTQSITIANESDAKTVDVPDLALPQSPKQAPEPLPPPPPPPAKRNLVPYLVGGGAVALAGGALGFHLWGNAIFDDAKDQTRTHGERQASWDAANTRRYVAQGLLGGALACAGIAIYLGVRGHHAEHAAAVALAPSADGIGVSLGGAW